MEMRFPEDFINKIICGDCMEIMQLIPDKAIDTVITDPPWPGCKVKFVQDEYELFARAATEINRIAKRLIVILGCDIDPRFLNAVPKDLPFLRVCWMRYIPCRYKGNILITSDVAYVFGEGFLPDDHTRVLGGECMQVSRGFRDPGDDHPTPRPLNHLKWLVAKFSRSDSIILDPFAGSGVTAQAAKILGRKFIAIDIEKSYCTMARKKLNAVVPELLNHSTQKITSEILNFETIKGGNHG